MLMESDDLGTRQQAPFINLGNRNRRKYINCMEIMNFFPIVCNKGLFNQVQIILQVAALLCAYPVCSFKVQ